MALKWGVFFGGAVLFAAATVGVYMVSPYTEGPPKALALVPLSKVKRGATVRAVDGVATTDQTSVKLVAVIDWANRKGLDGQGRPLAEKTLLKYAGGQKANGHLSGVYFDISPKTMTSFRLASMTTVPGAGPASMSSGSNTERFYYESDQKVDLSKPIEIVLVSRGDPMVREPVAVIACKPEGSSQGFEWKLAPPVKRWDVLRKGYFSTALDVTLPQDTEGLQLSLSTEKDEREGTGILLKGSKPFDADFLSDDLKGGVYGIIWARPEFTLVFTCTPQGSGS